MVGVSNGPPARDRSRRLLEVAGFLGVAGLLVLFGLVGGVEHEAAVFALVPRRAVALGFAHHTDGGPSEPKGVTPMRTLKAVGS